jgi:hypothetical protein
LLIVEALFLIMAIILFIKGQFGAQGIAEAEAYFTICDRAVFIQAIGLSRNSVIRVFSHPCNVTQLKATETRAT